MMDHRFYSGRIVATKRNGIVTFLLYIVVFSCDELSAILLSNLLCIAG